MARSFLRYHYAGRLHLTLRKVNILHPTGHNAIYTVHLQARNRPLINGLKAQGLTNNVALQENRIKEYEKKKGQDRKSTRLNSSHANISYAVFCLKKKKRIYH